MSSCDFIVPFAGPAEQAAGKIRSAFEKNNGTIEGDAAGGTFAIKTPVGSASGSYKVTGQQLHIVIDAKPVFVTCGMIEKYLADFLAR